MVRGVYPPYTLSGPTTKKNYFLSVSSLISSIVSLKILNYIIIQLSVHWFNGDYLSSPECPSTGQFMKKVFSDLADGFNIALVDRSTDFSLLSTSIVYTFELQWSPNQIIFPSFSCVLLFSQNSRPLRRKFVFRETPCSWGNCFQEIPGSCIYVFYQYTAKYSD